MLVNFFIFVVLNVAHDYTLIVYAACCSNVVKRARIILNRARVKCSVVSARYSFRVFE